MHAALRIDRLTQHLLHRTAANVTHLLMRTGATAQGRMGSGGASRAGHDRGGRNIRLRGG